MEEKIIYLDNAATTMKKPDCVVRAICDSLTTFGGPGRGVHQAALASSMAIFECRNAISELLHVNNPSQIALTNNATHSLNIAINGLLNENCHAITTAASHNSILRPLYLKNKNNNCDLTIVPIEKDGSLDMNKFESAFQSNTKLVVATHSSNLTGDIYDIKKMVEITHEKGAIFVLDAAQTAGVIEIDNSMLNCDVICLTGHKSLYGPQGTGALYVSPNLDIPPLIVGGSGMHSYDEEHPKNMPESLEAGTLNAHGYCGLAAGINYVIEKSPTKIKEHIDFCISRFEDGISNISNIKIYGGGSLLGKCGICAILIGDQDSSEISDILSTEYNIATRPGAHCAPKMHESLNTTETGLVRFSFCSFTTYEEIDYAISALKEISSNI